MAVHLLRFSPLSTLTADHHHHHRLQLTITSTSPFLSTTTPLNRSFSRSPHLSSGSGSGSSIPPTGGGGSSDHHSNDPEGSDGLKHLNPLALLIQGWRSRVSADPQFPFKLLMEELVGVTACVLGDMATRPNFGLRELDFVFSTLVVGSILNFVLMYLLAPTAASAASSSALPGIFARSPTGHMFEVGAYSVLDRMGTLVYKGAVFGAVGFAAGLVGTAISNGLIALRKKMDPEFATPNKTPPTLLNACTWAIQMGVSSNFRYQSLNGIEYLLARALNPVLFKVNVVGLRCLNNVLGGMSFVVLARLTGSQKVGGVAGGKVGVEKLIGEVPLPVPIDDSIDRESRTGDSVGLDSSK